MIKECAKILSINMIYTSIFFLLSINYTNSVLRTVFSAHVALLHWQPMPHQYIIDFLGKSI